MLRDVVEGLREPRRIARGVRWRFGRLENRVLGFEIMREDWDNLILLDGCRHDMFSELNFLPGRLESRRSRGSATVEFVENNFVGSRFDDTVYVSANPYMSMYCKDAFHHLAEPWKTEWDEDWETVLPGDMTRVVREVNEAYPNKRLIAHYMQPHHPFLGQTAERELRDLDGNLDARRSVLEDADGSGETIHVWNAIDELDVKTVRKAYQETLEEVLDHVEDLLGALDGLTVVTSDHGNLLGEPPYSVLSVEQVGYGHPPYRTAKPLVTVPWFVCPYESRKSITTEPAPERDVTGTEQEKIDERLESLGYRQ